MECGAWLHNTPLYMSLESVARGEYEAPTDIWSLVCAMAEMILGKLARKFTVGAEANVALFWIGFGDELPKITKEYCQRKEQFEVEAESVEGVAASRFDSSVSLPSMSLLNSTDGSGPDGRNIVQIMNSAMESGVRGWEAVNMDTGCGGCDCDNRCYARPTGLRHILLGSTDEVMPKRWIMGLKEDRDFE
ncbi:hypothetical protein ACLOJK_004199 [Asimina triloba]